MKILFIDDDVIIEEFFAQYCQNEHADCEVFGAVSCEEGFRKALELKPDIIVLDIMLPGQNGWEIAERLKQTPATAQIPIIVASGAGSFFEDKPEIKVPREYLAGYVRKPYDVSDLMAAIRKVLAT
ncbi:MAG: response regulator [Kiritimatiellae bacterium]|nr:response regulator [Kiritimatiellia bacterium]